MVYELGITWFFLSILASYEDLKNLKLSSFTVFAFTATCLLAVILNRLYIYPLNLRLLYKASFILSFILLGLSLGDALYLLTTSCVFPWIKAGFFLFTLILCLFQPFFKLKRPVKLFNRVEGLHFLTLLKGRRDTGLTLPGIPFLFSIFLTHVSTMKLWGG